MPKPNTSARAVTLRRLIRSKKLALEKAPPGSLRVANIRGHDRYYHVVSCDAKVVATYLGKDRVDLTRKLAQKGYDRKVLDAAERELEAWELLAAHFPDKTVEEVYDTLAPARQKYVTPVRLTDEEFRKQWESVTYEPGYFRSDAAEYYTDRGERVRSKSEQLIANLLFRLGIPYRYEYPVTVYVDGKPQVWRTDFTILDVKNRKEYYLEHFGMLGDAEYAKNAFRKMRIYEENGMYEGSSMLYSFETYDVPLDIRYLERKVRRTLGV